MISDNVEFLKMQNCSSNGDLSLDYYSCYSPFFPCTMNLSTADLRNYKTEFHETRWSYRYMFLVDPKVFRFVVKGVKAISFLCRVLAAILKMADILKISKTQDCSSNGYLSLYQIVCLYHYPFRSYQH
jgi:hypothetical protein